MSGLISLITAAFPIFQSHQQHHEEMYQARRAHKESMEQERLFHRDSQKLEFLTHHRQVRLDKEAARRENVRDLWTMRNQRIQNLMLTDTVMLGAGVTLGVEGIPAADTDRLTIILYTILIAASFCFLLSSIWCLHAMQQRMNQFNVSSNKQLYYCKLGKRMHENFVEFYKCHCSMLNYLALRLFFLGTAALLFGIFLHLHSKLNSIYGARTPGLILWATLVILFFILLCLRKNFPSKTLVTEESELRSYSHNMQVIRPVQVVDGSTANYEQCRQFEDRRRQPERCLSAGLDRPERDVFYDRPHREELPKKARNRKSDIPLSPISLNAEFDRLEHKVFFETNPNISTHFPAGNMDSLDPSPLPTPLSLPDEMDCLEQRAFFGDCRLRDVSSISPRRANLEVPSSNLLKNRFEGMHELKAEPSEQQSLLSEQHPGYLREPQGSLSLIVRSSNRRKEVIEENKVRPVERKEEEDTD